MNRFDLWESSKNGAHMKLSQHGEFVRYEDVKSLELENQKLKEMFENALKEWRFLMDRVEGVVKT
jgi:hypothetical protein